MGTIFWTSGGLLNLTKCAYYILAWSFDEEGRAIYIPKNSIPLYASLLETVVERKQSDNSTSTKHTSILVTISPSTCK
jgi:hypothetical protein